MSCNWCNKKRNLIKCDCGDYYCKSHKDRNCSNQCPHCDKQVCMNCGIICVGCSTYYCEDMKRCERGLKCAWEINEDGIADCNICKEEFKDEKDIKLFDKYCEPCITICDNCGSNTVEDEWCEYCDGYYCPDCHILDDNKSAKCHECAGIVPYEKYKNVLDKLNQVTIKIKK